MERTLEAGEVLINSLLLLETSLSQSSREYGCEIRQDMFLQPNQKGLNTLFHLLLDRLKGREFIKKVRDVECAVASLISRDIKYVRTCFSLDWSAGAQGGVANQGQRAPTGLQQGEQSGHPCSSA